VSTSCTTTDQADRRHDGQDPESNETYETNRLGTFSPQYQLEAFVTKVSEGVDAVTSDR
jgi:hypothetical protein